MVGNVMLRLVQQNCATVGPIACLLTTKLNVRVVGSHSLAVVSIHGKTVSTEQLIVKLTEKHIGTQTDRV